VRFNSPHRDDGDIRLSGDSMRLDGDPKAGPGDRKATSTGPVEELTDIIDLKESLREWCWNFREGCFILLATVRFRAGPGDGLENRHLSPGELSKHSDRVAAVLATLFVRIVSSSLQNGFTFECFGGSSMSSSESSPLESRGFPCSGLANNDLW